MFITAEKLKPLMDTCGQPETANFEIPLTSDEYFKIKQTQKNGRCHDFTFYINKDDKYIVIAKHNYPPGLYRAPSGGVAQGEDLLAGMNREVLEETGCRIELKRFVLNAGASFQSEAGIINWHTYVFLARYIEGDFNFTDAKEIREVRLAKPEEFEQFSRIMRGTTVGGLHYRAALHDAVKKIIESGKV